ALWTTSIDDDLVEGRLSFQRGDVALQLGLFDTSERELDRAVRALDRSEALPQERARFLARRGTLARLRGDLQGSSDYFRAAAAALAQSEADPVDAAFTSARIDDEGSYAALAKGDFESAIVASTTAIAAYRDYQKRRDVDATFRIARASLRLAVAYAFRGLAVPYRRPLPATLVVPGHAPRADLRGLDIKHADEELAAVMAQLTSPGSGLVSGSSAVRGLLREARLVSSYIAHDPQHALELAERAAHDARFDYQRAESHTGRAHALLRLGRHEAALEALDTAAELLAKARDVVTRVIGVRDGDLGESGDLGLVAQVAIYRAAAQLAVADQANAAETLCVALEDEGLARFHEGLLRTFGEVAETVSPAWRRHRRLRALLGMNGTGPSTPARLPDALVAAWRSRSSERREGDVG
ncbi:MAG TPA: hypothetical protein VFD39_00005, partial [Trueperaceae bacterium]|nr:hypothetical protein [Trueperaceae bacterium]